MTRKTLATVGIGLLLAAAGCVSCGHDACSRAIEAGPHCEAPQCDRRHVYAVLINGLTPGSCLEELRLSLAERGFEKSFRAELLHTAWVWREMKRIQKCDPEARFVLVGYGFGSGVAAGMAKDASRDGITVDALVLLDPVGTCAGDDLAGRVVVIRSGDANCSHFSLPKQEATVDAITAVLAETAARVEHPAFEETPLFWHPDAPPQRDYTLPEGMPVEWQFLHERKGGRVTPLAAR